jgi:hypothetical protein
MKHLVIPFSLAGIVAATSAHGACDSKSKTLFSCATQKSGKRIEVCATANTIQYSFGKPNAKPELVLSVPKSQASTYQWEGVGRSMTYSVNIPNGDTEYRVYSGAEKATEETPDGAVYAGVHVVKNGTQIAEVPCAVSTVKSALEGLSLRRAEEW